MRPVTETPPHLAARIGRPDGDWVMAAEYVHSTPNGDLYVGDHAAGQLRVFDPTGKRIRSLPWFGRSVAISSWALAIVDASAHRVKVYDLEGQPRFDFPFEGVDSPEFDAFGLAVTETGHFFLLDRLTRRIQRFDAAGRPDTAWGERGAGPAQQEWIGDMAVDAAGNVFLLDIDLWRVQEFSPEGRLLQLWDLPHSVEFGAWLQGTLAVDPTGHPWVLDQTFTPGRLTRFGDATVETRSWDVPADEWGHPGIGGTAFAFTPAGIPCFAGLDRGVDRFLPEEAALQPFIPAYGSGPGEFRAIRNLLLLDDDTLLADLGSDPGDGFALFDADGRPGIRPTFAERFDSGTWSHDADGTFWGFRSEPERDVLVHLSRSGATLGSFSLDPSIAPQIRMTLLCASAGRIATLSASYNNAAPSASRAQQFLELRDYAGRLLQRRALVTATSVSIAAIAPAGAERFWLLDSQGEIQVADFAWPGEHAFPEPATLSPSLPRALRIAADGENRLLLFAGSPARFLRYDRSGQQIEAFGGAELSPYFDPTYGVPYRDYTVMDVSPGGTIALTVPSGEALIFKP